MQVSKVTWVDQNGLKVKPDQKWLFQSLAMNNTDINDQDLSVPSIWTHIETSTESVKKIIFPL